MAPVRGVLLDLDGTVHTSGGLIPGAVETIGQLRERGIPFLFTTNTSRKSRADVRSAMHTLGLDVNTSEIFTAAVAAARWLKDQEIERVHLLLAESATAELEAFEVTSACRRKGLGVTP